MMKTQAVDEIKVSCETCLNEVPRSGAMSAEVAEYVAHFCGLDCYEEWMENKRTEELKTRSD
jgi:hypothetical protein